jgi:hypothetical protein
MIECAYCEKPLICDTCGAEYLAPSEDDYRALSQPEVVVNCPGCGEVLVCHWCKTPYDGVADDKNGGDAPTSP